MIAGVIMLAKHGSLLVNLNEVVVIRLNSTTKGKSTIDFLNQDAKVISTFEYPDAVQAEHAYSQLASGKIIDV